VFARRGVMRVVTEEGTWLVPSARALWMPARKAHEIQCRTDLAMRTVYMSTEIEVPFGDRCAVIEVSPLLREVILRLVEGPVDTQMQGLLVPLLISELGIGRIVPFNLPEPRDARLRRVTAMLSEAPADRRRLEDWAAVAGMARRSFARRFSAETGMTFGTWRRRLRLLEGVERLAAGEAVTIVALESGYDSVSAFIQAFRREFGVTPGRYFREIGSDPSSAA
jgi:AraC-like DNA-binding protein